MNQRDSMKKSSMKPSQSTEQLVNAAEILVGIGGEPEERPDTRLPFKKRWTSKSSGLPPKAPFSKINEPVAASVEESVELVGAPIQVTIPEKEVPFHDYSLFQTSPKRKREEIIEEEEEEEVEEEEQEEDPNRLYCVCRQPYVEGELMIACDKCDEWFHTDCIGIGRDEVPEVYKCKACKKKEMKKKKQIMEKKEPKRKSRVALGRQASVDTLDAALELAKMRSTPTPAMDTRFCAFPTCQQLATGDSQYCSEECGLKNAKAFLEGKLGGNLDLIEPEIFIFNTVPEAVDTNGVGRTVKEAEEEEEVKEEKVNVPVSLNNSTPEEVTHMLESHAKELLEINSIIDGVFEYSGEESKADSTKPIHSLDCPSCGVSFPAYKLVAHHDQCFLKTEGQVSEKSKFKFGVEEGRVSAAYCNTYDERTKLYCKKLACACPKHANLRPNPKRELCLYPLKTPRTDTVYPKTMAISEERCCVSRRECFRHSGWEVTRKSQILQEITLLKSFLEDSEGGG